MSVMLITYHLLSTYCMTPNTSFNPHCNPIRRYYCYPHCSDGESEAQKGFLSVQDHPAGGQSGQDLSSVHLTAEPTGEPRGLSDLNHLVGLEAGSEPRLLVQHSILKAASCLLSAYYVPHISIPCLKKIFKIQQLYRPASTCNAERATHLSSPCVSDYQSHNCCLFVIIIVLTLCQACSKHFADMN